MSVMKKKIKRRFLRYKIEESVIALIDFNGDTSNFKPTLHALVINESYGGAGLLLLSREVFKKGIIISVKTGKLPVLLAKVCWINKLDDVALSIGIEYLN